MSDKDNNKEEDKLLYCSFCGKNQNEVRKLIAGPSVYICNECIDLCNDIILEEINEINEIEVEENFPVPIEIKYHSHHLKFRKCIINVDWNAEDEFFKQINYIYVYFFWQNKIDDALPVLSSKSKN